MFLLPLRTPLPPTLAQSLPSPPGSLNPPLVSQPPTQPNIYGHFYGQPGPGIIFPLNTQGSGCLWPEHNTDLCQVLAARERERAGRGSLSPSWEAPARRSSPTPTKAAGPALHLTSVPNTCCQSPQDSLPWDQTPKRPSKA